MKYIIIHFNKKIYKINRELNESIDVFYKRAWFIAHKEPNTDCEFDNIENISFIWRNHNVYGVQYNKEIMKLIS